MPVVIRDCGKYLVLDLPIRKRNRDRVVFGEVLRIGINRLETAEQRARFQSVPVDDGDRIREVGAVVRVLREQSARIQTLTARAVVKIEGVVRRMLEEKAQVFSKLQ